MTLGLFQCAAGRSASGGAPVGTDVRSSPKRLQFGHVDANDPRPSHTAADTRHAGRGPRELLSRKVVGQASALEFIIPSIKTYQAGLNAPDRPAGVFLLLGPTGTGKTRTVEALAEILHGSAKHLLKIDCAEYQADHEVAKLIGAPPGTSATGKPSRC